MQADRGSFSQVLPECEKAHRQHPKLPSAVMTWGPRATGPLGAWGEVKLVNHARASGGWTWGVGAGFIVPSDP